MDAVWPGRPYNRATMAKSKKKPPPNVIAQNKRARFEYDIEETFEAGLVLQGWEVKSIRAGKAQLTDAYVLLKDGEAWLFGANITPLPTASTHFVTDPQRTRKLLLHDKEIARLFSKTQQKGFACVCLDLHWKKHLIKARIGLGKGRAKHDKRDVKKEQDWNRQKEALMKQNQR